MTVWANYEKREKANGVPKPMVLFTGSSTFYYWYELEKDFSDFCAVNRATPGATFASLNADVDHSILRYKPQAIVVLAGENDVMAETATPQSVVYDMEALLESIHAVLPETKVILMGTKMGGHSSPGFWPNRWCARSKIYETMDLMAAYVMEHSRNRTHTGLDPYLSFLDGMTPMLGEACYPDAPKNAYMYDDCLHLNDKGFKEWLPIIRDQLERSIGIHHDCKGYTPFMGLEKHPAWVSDETATCQDEYPYQCEGEAGEWSPVCDGTNTLCEVRNCTCGCVEAPPPLPPPLPGTPGLPPPFPNWPPPNPPGVEAVKGLAKWQRKHGINATHDEDATIFDRITDGEGDTMEAWEVSVIVVAVVVFLLAVASVIVYTTSWGYKYVPKFLRGDDSQGPPEAGALLKTSNMAATYRTQPSAKKYVQSEASNPRLQAQLAEAGTPAASHPSSPPDQAAQPRMGDALALAAELAAQNRSFSEDDTDRSIDLSIQDSNDD